MFEDDSEPIFYMYPPEEEEFMYGDKEMVITDEPIFETYPSEEEFMFGEDNVVVTDKSIFDVYPSEGELELVEVKTKEEIVETELVVEDNIDGEIKADSEQLQVEELSHEMKITP